jgi:hypothetical protein
MVIAGRIDRFSGDSVIQAGEISIPSESAIGQPIKPAKIPCFATVPNRQTLLAGVTSLRRFHPRPVQQGTVKKRQKPA